MIVVEVSGETKRCLRPALATDRVEASRAQRIFVEESKQHWLNLYYLFVYVFYNV